MLLLTTPELSAPLKATPFDQVARSLGIRLRQGFFPSRESSSCFDSRAIKRQPRASSALAKQVLPLNRAVESDAIVPALRASARAPHRGR